MMNPSLVYVLILLRDLGRCTWARFRQTEDRQDLDWTIALLRLQLDFNIPDRWEVLGALADAHVMRYDICKRAADLDRAIVLWRDAIALCPRDHEDYFVLLQVLVDALLNRFDLQEKVEDLDEIIQLRRVAFTLLSEDHPDRPTFLGNLAFSLHTRFEKTGSEDDLDESIKIFRTTLAFHPEGHPDRSKTLSNLAGSLHARFERSGRVDDLNEAVRLHRAALYLCPEGHPHRSESLSNLANSLHTRFEESGSIDDLIEAIHLNRDALILRPKGHPDRSSSLRNLACGLQRRFEQSGSVDDLTEAIQLHHDALSLLPEGHPSRSGSLNNLANSLYRRFEQKGSIDDLNEAVRLHRDALSLLPEGHPHRSGSLNNLAISLGKRFKQNGSLGDLNEAVQLHHDALSLRPEGHPDHSSSLNNLACALHTRFEQSGCVDDLNEAVRLHRDALTHRPFGHPARSVSMFNIASVLYARFEKLGHAEDFEECVQLLAGAAAHAFSSTFTRLNAAYWWAMYARTRNHDTTLDAYRTAISLLQRALMVLPNLSERHDVLLRMQQYQMLGVDAASCAIEKGDLVAAVELLEQGRALLWSQMRGLRSPLDRLSSVNKELAHRFAVCCRQLETLTTSSSSNLSTLDTRGDDIQVHKAPKWENTRDEMLERVRKLTEEQEAIINEIRLLPGFEDFPRGASFDTLRRVASEGPVIVLNHSDFRCDALIVLPHEDDSCVCIPLDRDWFEDSLDLCDNLLRARHKRKVHSLEYDGTLRRTMKVLWDRVVSKVVEKLDGFGVAEGSRIWWCPTLFLSALPFHAAGPYNDANGVTKYLLDDYIPSYTPTLTSLIAARTGIRIESEKFLFVGDTKLPSMRKEFNNIRRHRLGRACKCLLDKEASRDSVLKALRKAGWVHFACHGILDTKPFESALALPGGKLTLLDIARANLPNAEFAFLSACHTAEQSADFALDEVLHLAAAIQFCGFRSVIGTMWQLLDRDGPFLADVVYAYLMNDMDDGEIRFKGAAAALRKAAIYLRSQKDWSDEGTEVDIMAERWVNLVHFGA